MKVADILSEKGDVVFTVAPDRTLLEAARALVERKVGALLVLDDQGHVGGMLTERDVLEEFSRNPDELATTPVRAAMITDLRFAHPDDEVESAQATMTLHRVRHLPVVSDGHLVGLISIGDVLKRLRDETAGENRDLKDYIAGKYSDSTTGLH